MLRLRILTIVYLALAIVVYRLKHPTPSTIAAGEGQLVPREWLKESAAHGTLLRDVRPADQTFLTYPEWFLVFSPAEQAEYFKKRTSTTFPYFSHIQQLWQGYGIMYDQIKNQFKFNTGYHVMIWVIGVSTSVEYGLKAFYETVIGGFTNPDPDDALTAEDRFNATYTKNYVTFIEKLPWYEFDFLSQLNKLWSEIPVSGGHTFRTLERRYYLTTELLVKAGYGWLIKQGTKSAYDEALLTTAVVLDKPFNKSAEPRDVKLEKLTDDGVLYFYPRYAAFKDIALETAEKKMNFKRIAGNNGAILISVLADKQLSLPNDKCKVLFTQPIATQANAKRIALTTTIPELSRVLLLLKNAGVQLEHVYDY